MLAQQQRAVRMAAPARQQPGLSRVTLRPAAGPQQLWAVRPQQACCRRAGPLVPSRRLAPVLCATNFAHPGEEASRESLDSRGFSAHMAAPSAGIIMAKGGGGGGNMGSGSMLGAVLERSRVEFVMPTPVVQGPKLDDSGSGGDIGKHNHNGGGGGDGDDGDDDDYFAGDDGDGEGGEGGPGGDSFWRVAIPELYDTVSVGAVLAEWFKTVADLPLVIRRAVEMGLFSSAQLVRFMAMDVRPNVTRAVSRALPPSWARDMVGRLMADPAFVQKLVVEQVFALASSMLYEYQARGAKFMEELDLVAINTLGFMAATGAACWVVAPTRSYGALHKFPWQSMLSELPNCVFDKSAPLRAFSNTARAAGFVARAAELSAVGAACGATTSLAASAAVALRRRADPTYVGPSVPVPSVGRSSAGLAAFFAINANTRYQLIGGMDRYLFDHSNFLWTYVGFSGLARLASNRVGEASRPWWQGLPDTASVRASQPRRAAASGSAAAAARRRVRRRKVGASAAAPAAASAAAAASAPEATAPEAGSSGARADGYYSPITGDQTPAQSLLAAETAGGLRLQLSEEAAASQDGLASSVLRLGSGELMQQLSGTAGAVA